MSFATILDARKVSQPELFGTTPFWNPGRLATLKELLGPLSPTGETSNGIPRVIVEWRRVLRASSMHIPAGPINPFIIPSTYGDPEGEKAALKIVDTDMDAAPDLALRWLVMGDTAAAYGAVRIIQAWTNITEWQPGVGATSMLVWSDRIPKLIQAAMMLENFDGFTTAMNDAFKDTIQRSINAGYRASLFYTNNVGMWGTVFDIAAGVYLKDRALFMNGIRRWRSLFDDNIENNVPIHEVYRQENSQGDGSYGLWYSNFTVYALTIAAEWARYGGEWLYDYKGKDGSTFRGLVELVRYWTRNPALFPYNSSGTPSRTVRTLPSDEITHALWPNEDSQWLLDNYPDGSDRDSIGVRGAVLIYRNRPLYG